LEKAGNSKRIRLQEKSCVDERQPVHGGTYRKQAVKESSGSEVGRGNRRDEIFGATGAGLRGGIPESSPWGRF